MEKLYKWFAIALMAVLVALSIYGYVRFSKFESDNAKLRGLLAEKDKTIQTIDGAYVKIVQEHDKLKATNEDLQKTIAKQKEDVISAQQAAVSWKKKYDDLFVSLTPSPLPGPGWEQPKPQKCTDTPGEFFAEKDYGLVKSKCTIYTYDPATQMKLSLDSGSRPLKLNLALTRDKNKLWRSYVKVEPPDDQNLTVDIVSTSVNMEPLEERWYEKLSVHLDIGVGNGVLGGAGASYRFGQFDLGPSIWGATVGSNGSVFYGLNFSWSPFKLSH